MTARIRRVAAALLSAALFSSPSAPADDVVFGDVAVDEIDITLSLPRDDEGFARSLISCDTRPARCEQAVELMLDLPFGWHLNGYTVELHHDVAEVCTAPSDLTYAGCIRPSTRTIHLGTTQGHWAMLRTFTHEVGHSFHQSCGALEDAKLTAYAAERGLPDGIARSGHLDGAHASIQEDFAETAMAWLTYGHDDAFSSRSPYGEVDADELNRLAEMFFRVCV